MHRLVNSWISPTGEVHHVGYFGHSLFASELIRASYPGEYRRFRGQSPACRYVEFLESLGWKRITTWRTKKTEFSPRKRWPAVQQRAVVDIFNEREEPVPKSFEAVT